LGGAMMLAVWVTAAALPALAEPDPAVTVHNVAHDLNLQTDLPGVDSRIVSPRSEHRPALQENANSDLNPFVSGVIRFVLYAALVVGILFALWTIRDLLPSFGRRKLVAKDEEVKVARDASVERMVEAQTEADELAQQGRIAEAMHALLLRSLIEVRKRLNISFADSLTSREILKALSLPEVGKTSLADIIKRVEFVHFGDHHAGEQDYAACRASYELLTQAMQTRRAA
jgi:hypothetical protein